MNYLLIFVLAVIIAYLIYYIFFRESFINDNDHCYRPLYPGQINYYSSGEYPYWPKGTFFKPLDQTNVEPMDFEGGTYQKLYTQPY